MAHISQSQHDPKDVEKQESLLPHEFYNLYIRKEGEKVLSAEEYAQMSKEFIKAMDERDKKYPDQYK